MPRQQLDPLRRSFTLLAALLLVLVNISGAHAQSISGGPNNGPATSLDPSRPLLGPADVNPGRSRPPRASETPPSATPDAPSFKPVTSGIESDDLAPVIDGEGTGLPIGVWHGLSADTLEKLFAKLTLPPRSPVLSELWSRFLQSRNTHGQEGFDPALQVLRLEALYRSGQFDDLLRLEKNPRLDAATRHMVEFISSKAELGLDDGTRACRTLQNAGPAGKGMPRGLALDLLKMTIYCRAQSGDLAGANLVLDLARDQGADTPYAAKALYALENKRRSAPRLSKRAGLIDYKFSTLFEGSQAAAIVETAKPPVLKAFLAEKRHAGPASLMAGERAARMNLIPPGQLAEVYATVAFNPGDLNDPLSAVARYQGRPEARALLYKALSYERSPVRRAQLAQQLLKAARKDGLYHPVAVLLSGPLEQLPQTNDLAWFAESAIEIALAAGKFEKALSWAVFGSADPSSANAGNLLNWLTLIDIGSPENTVPNGAGLSTTEEAALAGKFSPETLHRLVTVLDALKYDVPIRLWNRASSAPQPKGGYLPETGILSELQSAARNQQFGKVILYSIIALGPEGPPGAHMIALGDTIKALSAIGLKNEARRVALESLYSVWPRLASY